MKHVAVFCCLVLCGCATPHRAPVTAASPETMLGATAQSDLYLGVVDGLIRQHRYQAAIAFLAKYQQGAAPSPRFRLLAGQALAGAGRTAEAIASYRGALSSGNAAPAYDGIGRAQGAQGQWGEAAENFRRATALDPANAEYLNNLGYAELNQNLKGADLAGALDALGRAHELDPASPRILGNLALATARAGQAAQLRTLLDTIPDPARRRMVADFTRAWNPGAAAPADTSTP